MSAHGAAGPSGGGVRPARPEDRPAVPGGQPDLRVVESIEHLAGARRRRIRLAIFGAASFVAAVVFGLVGVHVVLAQNQFRLDRLNTTTAAQEAQYERLRLQVDQLEAPQRIVATAEGKLGMVSPARVTYLTPSPPVTAAPPTTAPSTTIPAAGDQVGDWAAVKPQLVPRP